MNATTRQPNPTKGGLKKIVLKYFSSNPRARLCALRMPLKDTFS